MKALFLSVFLALCFWQGASAREITAEEKADLQAQIARFETALKQGDFDLVGASVPPKVLQHIATKAGVDVATLRSAMQTQMQIALASVKFLDFDMDVDKAAYKQAPDGTPYVLVPSRSLMETQGQKIEAKTSTLALIDDGKWYLVRIDDAQQINIVREVYPSLATATFPTGTMTPVE
ncbi:hypothetical protein [uncultured Agrobacterium sp.]|uniref:hypothetical protein n=1 Tax=uncultured Agrobacterium sp. TaxID=157277 RepID=UPI0025E2B0A2|nr:hypothetical protein [uncultured Agrobacterium sp.]